MQLFIVFFFFFFSSRRRHTRCREVSWARRCVQETAQYEIVREVLDTRFQCKFVESESECDILWFDTGVTEDVLMRVRPYQRINHFPAMYCIHKKNFLCKNLKKMGKELPRDYNFFPRTWMLPVEGPDFRNQFDEKKKQNLHYQARGPFSGKGNFSHSFS
eukprot:TRINITY_DN18684_c0_g1_i1.p2 TRINITY_DN18684_c0_g1~~TRINITY_DN18684_c0_g1_i1.p2  ORF type:complete len:160 (+),score=40.46 TRINITY_DN18684_c0_g1_i1:75-554(+)